MEIVMMMLCWSLWNVSQQMLAAVKDPNNPAFFLEPHHSASPSTSSNRFCRYFDVEERYVMCEDGRYAATAELLEPLIDEHTIGAWDRIL